MDRSEIIRNLVDAFYDSMKESAQELGFDKDELSAMKGFILQFFTEQASQHSDQELLSRFGNMEEVTDMYIDFLKSKLEIGNATIH